MRQVIATASLKQTAGIPPFFEKSTAMWLAIAALPPLPINIIFPPSCDARLINSIDSFVASGSESFSPALFLAVILCLRAEIFSRYWSIVVGISVI